MGYHWAKNCAERNNQNHFIFVYHKIYFSIIIMVSSMYFSIWFIPIFAKNLPYPGHYHYMALLRHCYTIIQRNNYYIFILSVILFFFKCSHLNCIYMKYKFNTTAWHLWPRFYDAYCAVDFRTLYTQMCCFRLTIFFIPTHFYLENPFYSVIFNFKVNRPDYYI